ncbi:hypothetical protein [Streptomyces minutiscleroticus]|uniref:hypothetical protein n=1 Tax=Streptomyces minutiscleroticus TaxID=68238 RepID=UPI001E64BC19|nr:hypothetical protein [Streptomyces minutiscleroticus]
MSDRDRWSGLVVCGLVAGARWTASHGTHPSRDAPAAGRTQSHAAEPEPCTATRQPLPAVRARAVLPGRYRPGDQHLRGRGRFPAPPDIRQPDGARIHDRLAPGRRPGEIVPLATLTHELGGDADWPEVGDWETVITDLVRLIRTGRCDALSLGLPSIARALLCTGPYSQVRAYDRTAGQYRAFGPAERAEVLAGIGSHLLHKEAGRPLWPGEGLLTPLGQH